MEIRNTRELSRNRKYNMFANITKVDINATRDALAILAELRLGGLGAYGIVILNRVSDRIKYGVHA